MKKVLHILLLIILIVSFSSCKQNDISSEYDEKVNNAIQVITYEWENYYNSTGMVFKDRYVKIINTRIIYIKDDAEQKHDIFKDVDYIVQFELLSNYFNSSPYYENISMNDNVIVMKNGESKVGQNILRLYRSMTYSYDYTDIIESIQEYGDKYNQILNIE